MLAGLSRSLIIHLLVSSYLRTVDLNAPSALLLSGTPCSPSFTAVTQDDSCKNFFFPLARCLGDFFLVIVRVPIPF